MLGINHVQRWLGIGFDERVDSHLPPTVQTQFSATVFWGQADEWVHYLGTPRHDRYDGPTRAAIHWDREARQLSFEGENEESRELFDRVNDALNLLRKRLAEKPWVADVLDSMLFGHQANEVDELALRSSSKLPSEATREIHAGGRGHVAIVLQNQLVDETLRQMEAAGSKIKPMENLGLVWPVLRRLISQLAYSGRLRDRYFEKIDLISQSVLISANILYGKRSRGRLVPTIAGEIYEHFSSERSGIKRKSLFDEHPYFRLLNELGTVLLKETAYHEYEWFVKVAVREYLDDRYMRLSVAGIMPDLTEAIAPMPYRRKGKSISTPLPRLGRYGILDREDLLAWRDVEGPFRDMGFTIIGQLGMGEFGRVYEAINLGNPTIPQRVALKVDRLMTGKKKVIKEAEMAMQIGRDLARSPHIIRLYDAGKLKKRELTYHVLQLVNGDTLDNLVGVTGREHSSVSSKKKRMTEEEARREYEQSVRESVQENWRRKRIRDPFTEELSLAQAMDLQTSIFLWVERVHEIGYAVNDLKNGNLMVSRRGQLKGIDLDAYCPISTPMDKLTDFLFLSTSLLLYLLHVLGRHESSLTAEQMLKSKDALRKGIQEAWSFGDVSEISRGRVTDDDVIETMTDLIYRCRTRAYIEDPDSFSHDIDHWIALKRAIFLEEMVLD